MGRKQCHLVGRDCPCPVAGRSLRASCPALTRMQTSLRNPCRACMHTPALGARATPTGCGHEVPEATKSPRHPARPGESLPGLPPSGTQRAQPAPRAMESAPLGLPPSGTQRAQPAPRAMELASLGLPRPARSGRSPRRVPSASPRLGAHPRRQGHHIAEAARHRPPGRRPAGRRPGKLSGARDGPLSAEMDGPLSAETSPASRPRPIARARRFRSRS